MSDTALFALDVVAITILVLAIYFPRHRRKDMVVAYFGVNVGVLVVAEALTSAAVSIGLGLGLFGVLSIIRLRSAELDQQEIAYYFVALALGLLGGIEVAGEWVNPGLMAVVLAVMFVVDHPRLFGDYRTQVVTLDRAFTSEPELVERLGELLDATIHRVKVRRLDLVNDTTVVEARFRLRS